MPLGGRVSWIQAQFLLFGLLAVTDQRLFTVESFPWMKSVMGNCRREDRWHCAVDPRAPVPPDVAEVCAVCGDYWSDTVGLTWCCRCDHKVFDFCWQAVYGEPVFR